MLKVGLTGGIGTGKSTVSQVFKEEGFPIIDADVIAKEVLKIYPNILEDIKETFGDGFFDDQGNLKRREFGSYIFKFSKERLKYENIILPYIKKHISTLLKEYENRGTKAIILDAPTLIENNMHLEMDFNILVYTSQDTQILRVMDRDNLTKEEVINRINAQMPLEDKKDMVNFIIDNGKSYKSTIDQVKEIISFINET